MSKNWTGLGAFAIFGTFVTVGLGGDYVYKEYVTTVEGDNAPLVWGFTVATATLAFFGLLNYCKFAQSEIQDELDRKCVAMKELEIALLGKKSVLTTRQIKSKEKSKC